MFEFAWIWMFALLPLPWLMAWFGNTRKGNASTEIRIPLLSYFNHGGTSSEKVRFWPSAFAALVWLCIVCAAANPVYRGEPIALDNEGRDIMLAVDLSGSMREQDMELNGRFSDRLSAVKHVLSQFIEQRQGDQLGLILFADTAFLQTPLTRDVATVSQMLNESQIGLVGQATAIGDALGLSVKRFNEKSDSNKVVILLTDGQNTAGNLTPDEALLLAQDAGVKVYTIGVGSEGGGMGFFNMMRSASALDEKLLTHIAKQTGGQYFRATDSQSLAKIYQQLDALEPQAKDTQTVRPKESLFYYPALAAAALIILANLFIMLRSALATRAEYE